MHPAFSVIFLTVLLGFGQGIFLALATAEIYAYFDLLPMPPQPYFNATGAFVALAFLVGGLFASFFHLGRPERAWRAAAQWRTSWLSREVIALPAFMGAVFLYLLVHFFEWNPVLIERVGAQPVTLSLAIVAIGTVLAFALFVCTAMIYASLKFLQEWHTPLTVINYILIGGASGFLFTAVLAAMFQPDLTFFFGGLSALLLVLATGTRIASLIRNRRIRPKSTLQTAIGVHHRQIAQKTQGSMGGSFNTREFFHGKSPLFLKSTRWLFLVAAFLVPFILTVMAIVLQRPEPLFAAVAIQALGLLVERWFFFAEANHPQNIYYQSIA
ncbi:MAG: DmsC/YnfH family molybdoenzyme membrane anchor subunit [Hyphomicrobiales bacterium]